MNNLGSIKKILNYLKPHILYLILFFTVTTTIFMLVIPLVIKTFFNSIFQDKDLKLRETEQRIKTTQISLEEAKQAYNIAHVRYRANLASNLEVKDSQLLFLQAKTTCIQSIIE